MRGVHSIGRRLSLQLATMTLVGMGLLGTGIYWSVAALIQDKQATHELTTVRIIEDLVRAAAAKGSEQDVLMKTQFYAPRRPGSRLELLRADGSILHRDADEPPFRLSSHVHRAQIDIPTPQLPGGLVSGAVVRCDCARDAVELYDDRAQIHSCLKCFCRRSSNQVASARCPDRWPRELRVLAKGLGVFDQSIACNPVSLGHWCPRA